MSDDLIDCPRCTDGERTMAYLIGDGNPSVPSRIEEETERCTFCDGTGLISPGRLPDDPHND